MISIKFEQNENELIFTCEGHAGQAEHGRDIVCASASILAYTLAHNIDLMKDEGKFKCKSKVMLNEGNACISCVPKEDSFIEALHTFKVVQGGFSLLAHNYPQYVELTMLGKA